MTRVAAARRLCLVVLDAMEQGDGPPTAGERVQQRANQIRQQGEARDNPLADLIAFEALDAQYKSAPGYPANMVLTMLYETHSFLGNHAASLRACDERFDRAFPDYLARKKQEPAESIDFTDLQAVACIQPSRTILHTCSHALDGLESPSAFAQQS
jgi:hypothetical protein